MIPHRILQAPLLPAFFFCYEFQDQPVFPITLNLVLSCRFACRGSDFNPKQQEYNILAMIPLNEPLHRVLCYFPIPGAGFHAGCGRSYLLGWVYRDVRWVTNQQKSCRQVRWPSACLWNGPYSGVASVLVLSSGTKSSGFLSTPYFL